MITNILITLWALFLVAVFTVTARSKHYSFQNFEATEIPYVKIDIQGNILNMVVDTGCAVSLLNMPTLSNCELLFKNSNKAISLSALTEDKVDAKAITVDFNIGKKQVTEDFYLQNVEDFGNFQKMHGITLHGLLGSSFFHNNECNIDFKNHRLSVL